MGVDITGMDYTTEEGRYFATNWWNWRPILVCCEIANEQKQLNFNTDYWGSNDGDGLDTQEQCNLLADALEEIAATLSADNCKFTINGRFAVNLKSWITEEGRMIEDDNTKYLDKEYTYAFLPPHIMVGDKKYIPSYQTSIKNLHNFITFLRSCGGFQIN